jgi:hypothetical protein
MCSSPSLIRLLFIYLLCAQLVACSPATPAESNKSAPGQIENSTHDTLTGLDNTPGAAQPTLYPTPVLVQEVTLQPENGSTQPAPQTDGLPTPQSTPQTQIRPIFDRFVEQVKNGNAEQVVGVYVDNILSLRVIQQPPDDPNYVSNIKGVATQFALAYTIAGNIGLLAHNYLSGALFFNIKTGDLAQLVYGDGRVEEYEVTDYHEYQALTPNSPTSDFLDLTTGEQLSANDLFTRIYTGEHRLVFQTCINQDNIDTWGRLFVLSFPY